MPDEVEGISEVGITWNLEARDVTSSSSEDTCSACDWHFEVEVVFCTTSKDTLVTHATKDLVLGKELAVGSRREALCNCIGIPIEYEIQITHVGATNIGAHVCRRKRSQGEAHAHVLTNGVCEGIEGIWRTCSKSEGVVDSLELDTSWVTNADLLSRAIKLNNGLGVDESLSDSDRLLVLESLLQLLTDHIPFWAERVIGTGGSSGGSRRDNRNEAKSEKSNDNGWTHDEGEFKG